MPKNMPRTKLNRSSFRKTPKILGVLLLIISLFVQTTIMTQALNFSSICTSEKPYSLELSNNRHLRKLRQYQTICRSKVASSLMIFSSTPTSLESAIDLSLDLFNNIKEFSKYNIEPLIILEPSDIEGNNLNFRQLATSRYNPNLVQMFQNLLKLGLQPENIGTIVLLPEANTPIWEWNGAKPSVFGDIFNQQAMAIRSVLPKAKLSIMLNSSSYEPDDLEWNNPVPRSFVEYTRNIKPEYIDSVGIQGFGWINRRNQSPTRKILDPKTYLNQNLITEVATYFGTKKIWINTGSFVQKYNNINERQIISNTDLLLQAQQLAELTTAIKSKGYQVSVNYFLADKTNSSEGTNWSLLSPSRHVVWINVVSSLSQRGIKLSMFDR